MTKLILSALTALALTGCAHGPTFDTTPQYQGLQNQPPYEPGECLVLGRDDVWRQCQ